MITYGDSSALVKLYIREAGSPEALQQLQASTSVAAPVIARVEVPAAIALRTRLGQSGGGIPGEQGAAALQGFDRDWPSYLRCPLRATTIEEARVLVGTHPLRSMDALHLACTLELQQETGEAPTFASFDDRLRAAAIRAGLTGWPVDLAAFRGGVPPVP